jgi:hypothetical protein
MRYCTGGAFGDVFQVSMNEWLVEVEKECSNNQVQQEVMNELCIDPAMLLM